jgi:predicted ATP-grasp superfamily ATP-dependent carboligase
MSVFLTDGEQRSTLAVTRALGRAGVDVTVGESERPSLAGSSRYCRQAVRYPSAAREPEKLADFFAHEMQRGGYRVLIPMTDVTTQLVSDMREQLRPAVAPIPGSAQVHLAQDKAEVLRIAQDLGICCPATRILGGQERIEEVALKVEYPAAVKPRWSHYHCAGRWVNGTVQYAYDAEDLITEYRAASAQMPQVLVQELVPGEGRGVFLLLWDGELKAAFFHRRVREKPPSGGVSVLCESLPLDERLLEQSLRLLKAIQWQGVAMVEYKLDRRDNCAKLMEINGRFWGSLQLAIEAGVNYPLMLYRLAIGEKVVPQLSYRSGVKSRWLLGDLDQLMMRLKRSEKTGDGSSRLRACLKFLKLYEKDMHYEVFKLNDPRPGWVEARHYLRAAFAAKEPRGAH